MGVALVLQRFQSYWQRRVRYCCICHLFHSTRHLTSCILLTRRSASVLKWACHAGCEAYKRRLAYSVTVRILAQDLLLNSFIAEILE